MQLRSFGSFAHDIASLLQSHVHSSPSRHTLSMPCQLSLFKLVRTQRGDSYLEEMDEYRPQEIYNFFESRIPCRNRRCFTIPWNRDAETGSKLALAARTGGNLEIRKSRRSASTTWPFWIRLESPHFFVSRSLKPICRSLREALYLCQHAHQPSGDPGGPRVLPHGASSKGDAAHSRSPELRLHAFHGQGFRQILHHDDWGYDFVFEPSCGFGFNWLKHAGAIYTCIHDASCLSAWCDRSDPIRTYQLPPKSESRWRSLWEGHGVKAVVGSWFFLETMMPKEALKKEDRIRLGSPWPKSRQCRIEQQDVVEECYGPSAPAHDLLALLKQGWSVSVLQSFSAKTVEQCSEKACCKTLAEALLPRDLSESGWNPHTSLWAAAWSQFAGACVRPFTYVNMPINLLAIPEDHEYYHTERVAKEMQLIPGALNCDFMHFMVKAFVRSCIMMIEDMTSSSNLVVVLDSTGWSVLEPYMYSWCKLSFRLVWSQWPYQDLSTASKVREQVAFSLGGTWRQSRGWIMFFLETMIPKEAFTPNILHPLTYCYWSGHYMRFKAGDESSIL